MICTFFNILNEYSFLFLIGTLKTIFIWALCSIISLLFGTFIGVLLSEKINNLNFICNYFSKFFKFFTFILRSIPFYVQILFAYFVIPEVFNFNISSFWAGVLSLGFCSGSYTSEIVRSGLNNIQKDQWDMSFIFGYSLYQRLKFIIFPQVFKNILPIILNEFNMILKSTSALSAIGTIELTKISMNIVSKSFNTIQIYTITAIIYLLISISFEILTKNILKRINND